MPERHEPDLDRVREAMREHDEQLREDERDDASRTEREGEGEGEAAEDEAEED